MTSRSALPRRRLPAWVRHRRPVCLHQDTIEERPLCEKVATTWCTSCGAKLPNHKS